MKNVKSLILSEMLSPSKAVNILQKNHSDEVKILLIAVNTVQSFLGKNCIAYEVLDKFKNLSESDFVKFLSSQLPESQKGTINGANVCERIISVSRRTKLA
jgi:hypothetical protein